MWPFHSTPPTKPWGLRWRCSMWYATFVVFFGLMSDTVVYSIVIPVMPFQLKQMGYHNISGRLGWLLFAYSAGLVISTPFFASCSERFKNRQTPLVLALLALILSQLFFMFAKHYLVMCVARIIQGTSSSGVFTVGLALLCDTTPEKHIGRQLGIGMAGFSVGLVFGPPVAGTLYANYGFRAPFYLGMAFAGVDLIARLLLIERKDAIPWGVDPTSDLDKPHALEFPSDSRVRVTLENESVPPLMGSSIPLTDVKGIVRTDVTIREVPADDAKFASDSRVRVTLENESVSSLMRSSIPLTDVKGIVGTDVTIHEVPADDAPQHTITPLNVLLKLMTSPRAVVCIFSTFVYGVVYSGQESVLVLHLADVYHLDAYKAGLAFIAAVIPTLISMPLTGHFSDKNGAEWVSFLALLLGIPWWGAITLKGSLLQFLVIYALETLFTSGFVSPLMTELAAVSRSIKGVGYAHVYGSFNLAFGFGSSVGPVLCGQMYDSVDNAWTVISVISISQLVVCLFLSIAFTGERPLLQRALGSFLKQGGSNTNARGMEGLGEIPLPTPQRRTEPWQGAPPVLVPQPTYGWM